MRRKEGGRRGGGGERLRVKLEPLAGRFRLLSLFIQTFAERQLRLPISPSFSWTLALLPSPTWRATHAHSKEKGRTCVFVAGHGGISVCRIRRRNNYFAQGRSERTCPAARASPFVRRRKFWRQESGQLPPPPSFLLSPSPSESIMSPQPSS